jgi:hypothetical protein
MGLLCYVFFVSVSRIEAAIERAADDAAAERPPAGPDGRPRSRRLAIGDPQAPLERFFAILERHRLLGDDGRLSPAVHLVSMGDHFDWGGRGDRERASTDALRLLSWLAAHPSDQVTLILGNHDLGRVGELVRFDDASFAEARTEAEAIYFDGGAEVDPSVEERFRRRHPDLPTAEIAARDFATFSSRQRALVEALLRARRFRVALAASERLLLCHAGVTLDDLAALGMSTRASSCATDVAAALDDALGSALAGWDGGSPLAIPHLHQPGDAAAGEGRGIFYHRPSDPTREHAHLFAGPPRRRFDPRRLPKSLVQGIGHIRDNKCRQLLVGWHDGSGASDGPLRHLSTDGREVRYARGAPARWSEDVAGIVFLDGGMAHAPLDRYEIFDLESGTVAAAL